MSPDRFDHLLALIRPRLERPLARREAVSPDEKLMITLCYLASGCQQKDLGFRFGRGFSTISNIVFETTTVIFEELMPIYLKFPETRDDWSKVSEGFWNKWQFPNCLGAIDGKHFKIRCPNKTGSLYFNYKNEFSSLVLAMCDSSYLFTYVEVGSYGREGDAGVFSRSNLYQNLEQNTLNIPESTQIPGTDISLPYSIIGDEAFPLKTFLMRPFPGRGGNVSLNYKTQIYNYRLSRARRTIENAFGILVSRWRLFLRPVVADINHTEAYIKAAFVLHNYLMIEDAKTSQYAPSSFFDRELSDGIVQDGAWRTDVAGSTGMVPTGQLGGNRYSNASRQQQFDLANFFVSPQGTLPWQSNMVSAHE